MEQNLNNKIENALEEIRPFLRGDGGDIELVSVEKNIVKVKLLGNCNSCSVNQMTLILLNVVHVHQLLVVQ